MTNAIDTAAIEALRTFALTHGELAFAHLCTAALAGEPWAVIRMEDVVMLCGTFEPAIILDVIRTTDTTRPDGAVARAFEI